MAKENCTVVALPASASIERLRDAITEIDSMSQSAFSEIATIAKLALASLEKPEAYKNPEAMAHVLQAIWGKALDAENYINCIAEQVGCNYIDNAERRRWAAQRKADARP